MPATPSPMPSSRSGCVNKLCNTNPATVRITHATHPLCGQCVSIQQTIQRKDELHFLIERPGGQVQLIPISWTDQAVVEPSAPGARFTPHQLITLRRWLDGHLQSNSLDKSEHVVSPKRKSRPFRVKESEATLLGGNDDELEQSISSQPTGPLARPTTRATATSAGSDSRDDTPALESSTDLEHPPPHVERGQ